jgi:hypothetical protein
MKVEDLDNYCLRITEKYMRYYYSSEAQLLKNETTEYEISEGLEIPTSVSPITITNFFISGNEVYGIYVEFLNKDDNAETVEISFDSAVTIELTEGNTDIHRTSLCTLELVEKK